MPKAMKTVRIGGATTTPPKAKVVPLKLSKCLHSVFVDKRGNPHDMLNLEPGKERYGIQLGSRKLQAVLDNIEDVKAFLKVYPVTAKSE